MSKCYLYDLHRDIELVYLGSNYWSLDASHIGDALVLNGICNGCLVVNGAMTQLPTNALINFLPMTDEERFIFKMTGNTPCEPIDSSDLHEWVRDEFIAKGHWEATL